MVRQVLCLKSNRPGQGHSAKSGALADISAKAENAVSLQLSTLSVAQKAIDKTESRDMAESGNKPEDKNMAESGNKSVSKDSAGKNQLMIIKRIKTRF